MGSLDEGRSPQGRVTRYSSKDSLRPLATGCIAGKTVSRDFSIDLITQRKKMIEQTRVHFDSHGVKLVGYLYRLANQNRVQPGVVLATGFTGTQDTPSLRATAQAFAAAGFAALTLDYRNFGESDGRPRQLIRIQGQLDDIHAAIRFARAQAGIDPERIALWGTSLGGGHVIVVAANDPRIAAVVAQIPFNGFPKQVQGRSSRETLRLLGAMIHDALRGRLGLTPRYIRAVGPTGELAVMATPQAQATIEAMQSNHWRNEIAPRILLEMMRYKPSDSAGQLKMPVLVSIAENDRETPPELARQIAKNAPQGESIGYPVAHFEFYRPDIRSIVLKDQINFLQKHLELEEPI
jgi:dienelactone hydrolase